MEVIKIQNIIATVDYGCRINMKTVAVRNSRMGRSKFPAGILKISDPKSTSLIFSTKMLITGTKSIEQAKKAAEKFADILRRRGNYDVQLANFQLKNIVGSYDMQMKINLYKLTTALHPLSSYEPELFPGVTIRLKHPKITVVVFNSGKLFITGAKTFEDLNSALNIVFPELIQASHAYLRCI